jgi:GT2 family glycosyltransferase
MRAVSSNNVFLRAEVVRAVGCFDERFGLGASYGAGEDSDYVLRALREGYVGTYDPLLIVLHPYKAHRPMQYYPGNVAVLARHCRGGGTKVLLARRLASGLLMTARRRLSITDYLGVVHRAIGLALRDGSPALPIGSTGARPERLAG